MTEKDLKGFKTLAFSGLEGEKGIFCRVTTRLSPGGGELDMRRANIVSGGGGTGEFLSAAGCERFFYMDQRHAANFKLVGEDSSECCENCDASATNLPGAALLAFSADCTVSVFYDRKNTALGVCHAGWKGVLLNAHAALFRNMRLAFGTRAEDLFVGVGPCISAANYPVKDDLVDEFSLVYGSRSKSFFPYFPDGPHLDLRAAIRSQLEEMGVKGPEFSGLCTYGNPNLLYSHRRGDEGRFALCAFLKK